MLRVTQEHICIEHGVGDRMLYPFTFTQPHTHTRILYDFNKWNIWHTHTLITVHIPMREENDFFCSLVLSFHTENSLLRICVSFPNALSICQKSEGTELYMLYVISTRSIFRLRGMKWMCDRIGQPRKNSHSHTLGLFFRIVLPFYFRIRSIRSG